jgi:hypothetical protein
MIEFCTAAAVLVLLALAAIRPAAGIRRQNGVQCNSWADSPERR